MPDIISTNISKSPHSTMHSLQNMAHISRETHINPLEWSDHTQFFFCARKLEAIMMGRTRTAVALSKNDQER